LNNYDGLSWEMYAMNGRRVLSGNTAVINATNLPKGIYSLGVKTSEGSAFVKIVLEN
jgi:hypothetical protein